LSTAQAIVEDEVRELVRRRGIDPVAEGGAVRQLVDEVVGDYSRLSAVGNPQIFRGLRRSGRCAVG